MLFLQEFARKFLDMFAQKSTLQNAALPPARYVDIRKIANPWRVDKKGKRWTVLGRRRAWKRVTGICLHQTACVLGERAERWATVGAHFGIMRSGRIVQIYDMDQYVVHGNGWNNGTIGIEIDGMFEGVAGDINTLWDDPSTPIREQPTEFTHEQMTSLELLVDWIVLNAELNGGMIKALVAHRQSSMDRRSDPGEIPWQTGLRLQRKHDLSDGGRGFEIGGRPIPENWNPEYKGVKY